jgi:hypothetical protein
MAACSDQKQAFVESKVLADSQRLAGRLAADYYT